jgi:hypothetical protein
MTDFSGTQGQANWYYGYWNKGTDVDGTYSDTEFAAFPNLGGPFSETNYWTGSQWAWYDGNPPWTSLRADGGHPSANNGGSGPVDHWAVRRWIAETNGPFRITGRIEHRTTDWVYVTQSGVAANSLLYVYLTAPGDGYIDDIKLVAGPVAEAGANLLPNGDFETTFPGPWTVSANHSGSAIVTNVVHGGSRALRMVASVGGTTQASAIWQNIAPALTVGQTYTLSYWFRPSTNFTPLTVRFSGNWITTAPTPCGDGTMARIFVDGVPIFSRAAFQSGADYFLNVAANAGSRIDFVLDAGSGNNDFCDSTTFTARIDTADPTVTIVADSAADWSPGGVQGEKNWFYGYYDRTQFPTYRTTNFMAFPRDNGPHSPNNYWNGAAWDWYSGNPPWDEIGQAFMHPNGVNNNNEHWVIRRWVSEVTGRVTVDWSLAKQNPGGNGVTGLIFHNAQMRDSNIVAGADLVGFTRSVTLTNVQVGDFIDLILTPIGVGATTDDASDGSYLSAVIRGSASLSGQIVTNIATAMKGINPSAYVRVPFVLTNASAVTFLTLRMKYDDGFVAYLNGVGVASRNAPVFPDAPMWNSTATATRSDADAVVFEDIDLTSVAGLLRNGTNVLSIQGLNAGINDPDFLVLPELRATSLTSDPNSVRYFTTPTPGSANGYGNTNVGPLIKNLAHAPSVPLDNEDLYVTAQVIPTFNPIASVRLIYRVMFSNEVSVTMFDDGQHADGAAGDSVYGGIIPASASSSGQMVRYYVFATDVRTNGMRAPIYDALNAAKAPEYFGTIVHVAQTNGLPLFHLFIPPATLTQAENSQSARFPCSVFYLGEFYDNCGINRHGQSSQGFPKKSYDIDFNPGYNFRWKEGEDRVDDINLLTTFPDKAHMRNMLAYETLRDAGSPYHYVEPIRVHTNGGFFGDWHLVENGDEGFLKRIGRDPNGALYKMYVTFTDISQTTISENANAEKKTRKQEGNADLVALFNGVNDATLANRVRYMYDNIDIAQVINTFAARSVTSEWDCCHKNYYFYRDSDNTGEWQAFAWDLDLSFGRNWSSSQTYWDDAVYPGNRIWGNWDNNRFFQVVLNMPLGQGINATRQMYLRRARTLMDQLQQTNGTSAANLYYEKRIDELATILTADAALDLAKWGTWGGGSASVATNSPYWRTLPQSVAELRTNYMPARRSFVFNQRMGLGAEFPDPQPTNVVILIGAIDYNPASANQAEEYVQLINTNLIAVDISGWKISGAVEHTFQGGVVIPPTNSVYLVANKKAFRNRATAPRGGMNLYIEGPYEGQLSARGEALTLTDTRGRLVTTNLYVGGPSLAQQYLRITELMYSPAAPPPGLTTNADEFEYIELKNIGPGALDLTGVHFSSGIEFTFTGSSVTNLGSGASVLVVRNLAAFNSRYGALTNVAGQYSGALDNNGETIQLDDASNEKILEFRYENGWYPITDGFGFSLGIVDDTAPWDTWGNKSSWRPSGTASGSPGGTNTLPGVIAGILINEVLAHTDLPQVDAVELFNPTAGAVNVGGWFITDDYRVPKKFRIPDGTNIAAGGYVVFTENEFNPGGTGFSFSSKGDEVYLFSGDAATNLTGYFHGFSFGASQNGVSFGRLTNSVGAEHFVAQRQNTLSNLNAGPLVGPLVISEIMFRPPELVNGSDNQDDEFIELRNISGTNVLLFDPSLPANTWRLRGGADFEFPSGRTLGASSNLLVVSFDTTNVVKLAALRAKYSIAASVQIFGPYRGKLDNSIDSVRLERPDAPESGEVPYILVDRVEYEDGSPWPEGADGTGAALVRRVLGEYGDDPANWTAGTPSAGADASSGTPPTIVVQPMNQGVVAYSTATFSVMANGTGLRYQWQRNGANVFSATNASYTINSVAPFSDATYRVAVYNDAGAVLSSNATLQVLIPATILQQPQSRTTFALLSASFSVIADSSTPISYQWRFNGMNISGATSATLTISNLQAAHDGDYTVVVTDAVGPVVSAVAHLTVLLQPLITTQPTNRLVVLPTTNITFVVVAQSGTPLRYQWQFNGTNIVGGTNTTLVLSNVQSSAAGTYRVAVSDNFGTTLSNPAELSLVVRPTITLHPISQATVPGGSATFTVEATGTEPLWFRWRRAGVNVSGANFYIQSNSTSSAFTIVNAGINDATNYTVVVTNVAGQAPVSQPAFLSLLVDSDMDGLPDSWETNQFGFNPNDPSDGAADTDGDGMSNAAEYQAGTDFQDTNSFLKVTLLSTGPALIQFQAVSNRAYTVQYTDGLSPALWRRLADVLVRTNTRIETVIDPDGSSRRFYRVATPVQR